MDVKFTWAVGKVTVSGDDDTVTALDWTLTADGNDRSAQTCGTQRLPPPGPGEPFTAFDDLTEAQVVTWVESLLGERRIKSIKAGLIGDLTREPSVPQRVKSLKQRG